jgi:NAD(P)-dependent dehydrogenase (short-subunit alcohol dehydrogenase family)
MSNSTFSGQVAIVTGGASGIGRAVGARLVQAGAQLMIVDSRQDAIAEAVAEIGARAAPELIRGLALDVRSPVDMERMRDETVARWGRIDILVACAGILRGVPGRPQTVRDTPEDAWDRVIDTNLTGTFLSNKAVLPTMQGQTSGNIINLSSTSGRHGLAYDAAYCASKFGVIGLTESLAEEVRPQGIRVHVVLPEAVDTPMLDQNGPLPRPAAMLTADQVADLILHLLRLPPDTVMLSPVLRSLEQPATKRTAKRS